MSATASGWVWDHSPYKGADFACHLALGDIANDANENRLWVAQASLAKKARCSRSSANLFLKKAVKEGFLKLLADNSKRGERNEYRFLMPDLLSIWEEGGCSTTLQGGVAPHDTGVPADTTPGVAPHDTKLNTTQDETQGETSSAASPSEAAVLPVTETPDSPSTLDTATLELPSPPEAAAPPPPVAQSSGKVKKNRASSYTPTFEEAMLCDLIADLYQANGNTRPKITASWYTEMHALLTADGPDGKGWPADRVETLIRWALADSFWRANIDSVNALRRNFGKLRERRNEDIAKARGSSSASSRRVKAQRSAIEEMREAFANEED